MAATRTAPKKAPEPVEGLEDLSIEQVDGASAILRLGKEERVVRQDDLHRAAKKIAKAVQETY